jgi:hypothetical protein
LLNLIAEDDWMPIVRITGQGLAAIAVSVGLLWGCFIGERLIVRNALAQRAQLMRELHRMQRDHQAQPVSAPSPFGLHPVHSTVG